MEQRFLSSETFAAEVVHAIVKSIEQTWSKQELCTLALSGGETPKLFLTKLATSLQFPKNKRLKVMQVDERSVPPQDLGNNGYMIDKYFLSHLTGKEIFFNRFDTTLSTTLALKKYAENYQTIDLALMGLGDDGHIASLFPKNIFDEESVVQVTKGPPPYEERMGLTFKALKECKHLLFTVTGEKKCQLIKEILEGGHSDLPMSRILRENTNVTILTLGNKV